MARYIDAERLKRTFASGIRVYDGMCKIADVMKNIENEPTADVVEIETLRSWLYSIATNNMGCDIKMTLSEACEDIISRLDGLRMFAKEKGGDQ